MSPILPVEIVERTIGFLRGDIPSLAACSLTCHALLPVTRVELWYEVELPVTTLFGGSRDPRTTAFLKILKNDPAIAPYVRSLVLYPLRLGFTPETPFNKAEWHTLSARLPALRSLRLRDFTMWSLYLAVSLALERPSLEALYLEDIRCTTTPLHEKTSWPHPSAQPSTDAAGEPLSGWTLRTLSIIGGEVDGEELSRLVRYLERAMIYSPAVIKSLDLCSYIGTSFEAPEIPSFGASLRHFGIGLRDIDVSIQGQRISGRDHIRRVISGLPQCGSLRSLRLCYEYNPGLGSTTWNPYASGSSRQDGTAPTPFFLELLADVLSAPGPAPLPYLEHLSLVFFGPPITSVGFDAAFSRLATVLVGDPGGSMGMEDGTVSRYPQFSSLDVRIVPTGIARIIFGEKWMEEERERQRIDRERFFLTMLAPFVRAGVAVHVHYD